MKPSKPIKRNAVVLLPNEGGLFSFYGRVWRRLDENQVVVLDCGSKVNIYRDDQLEATNYKGHWEPRPNGYPPRWVPMTSLQELKQMAGRYRPLFGGRQWTARQRRQALHRLLVGKDASIEDDGA